MILTIIGLISSTFLLGFMIVLSIGTIVQYRENQKQRKIKMLDYIVGENQLHTGWHADCVICLKL